MRGNLARVAGRRHVHVRAAVLVDLPQGGRIEVTEDGTLPTPHHGGDPSRLARALDVTNAEDTAVEPHQPAGFDAAPQGAAADPDGSELPMCDHPMLPPRDPREPHIGGWLS
jgi:hypothetical protein